MKKYTMGIMLLIFTFTSLVGNAQESRWYKGNTHCHTLKSDGDDWARRVVRWYRDHEYNFIAITDHDRVTEVKYLDTDPNDDFILIQSEEISDGYKGAPVHLNALNTKIHIPQQHGSSLVETLQNNVDAIRKAGAVPQLNHPNWKWAFTDVEMSQVNGVRLFELYNICLDCNNFGAGGYPGMEEIWDKILSQGILMYGVACDDAHDYVGEFTPTKSNPGTGWVMVRAPELTPEAILKAMEAGDFYATIGVRLKEVQITSKEYRIEIDLYPGTRYTTTFIGQGGRILKKAHGASAVYTFSGDELYVRARVFESSGRFACTQPVFIKNQK